MIIFVDIDETICTRSVNSDYSLAEPIPDRIAIVNDAYDDGHRIVYYTARGATTGIDWQAITEEQLDRWGCKYHELRLDKPFFDILIDDKACTIADMQYILYERNRRNNRENSH